MVAFNIVLIKWLETASYQKKAFITHFNTKHFVVIRHLIV